jgi:opacity protein-like surface antigen
MDEPETNDRGIYLGLSLMGTSFDIPEFSDGADTGGGLALEVGYNFNTNLGIFLNLDGSNMSPDGGEDYALAHFDLGVEGRLGDRQSSFRPFGKAAFLGTVASYETLGDDIEISGTGFGVGIGVYYFLNSNIAFDLGYTHSWISIDEVSVGSVSVEIEENATSGRLGLGFSYHF